jgi:serine/threonine protein kinase
MTSPERDPRSTDAAAADFPVIPVLLATDDVCDRFEQAWKAGEPLTIESVVNSLDPRLIAEHGEPARKLLSELIFLDVTYRRERGENPTPAEYSTRFPRFAETIHELLSTLGEKPRENGAPPRSPAVTNSVGAAVPASPENSATHQTDSVPKMRPAAAGLPGGPASGPARIGEYQILEEIGRGGMGVVYRACQVGLGRDVALKMILAGDLASEEVVRRFRIEAAAAARLQHPQIVAIHAIGEEQGRHYFSMELINGASAARRLRGGPFLPREAARITLTVARAVQYAHDHGVVHRDLKPANVLLGPDNNPHVTDFGIARFVASESTLTASSQGLGTPGFAAPEQLRGDKSAVSPAVDIYSLGATLYAFLTGHAPFQAATLVETARQVLDQEPVSPRLLNPAIPRDLETICLKCLSKSPASRYTTAADLADDLERALEGVPIRARPVSRAERAWRWCRRRPALASLAAVSSLSLLAAILLGTGHFLQVESLNDRLRSANESLHAAVDEANQARTRAEQNERAAMELAYVGDIQRAAGAWRSQDYRNLQELLDRQVPKPGRPDLRGFEWGSLRAHLTVPTRTLLTRDKPLYFACLSPDERWIGVCGQEAIVWLFDAASLALKQTIVTGQREVNGLAFTPDSRVLASAGDDGRVRSRTMTCGSLFITEAPARSIPNAPATTSIRY